MELQLTFHTKTKKFDKEGNATPINRITTVTLWKKMPRSEKAMIDSATVQCYQHDKDIPVLGKKFAVEKLLEKQQNKDIRKEVWEMFWNFSKDTKALKEGKYKNASQQYIKLPMLPRGFFKDM